MLLTRFFLLVYFKEKEISNRHALVLKCPKIILSFNEFNKNNVKLYFFFIFLAEIVTK